jgi:maltose alpha-D-glucosyltransferase / alpha-amylase
LKKLASATDPLWYKDAIIYELHVRAFADSNGDGIGDFPGLLTKLDYLQDLGVTCIWLLPFFPSPLRDDGYDIANYVDVNPSYGTLSDFKVFLDAAHQRNMQVMIELVINHTSDQHPWFKAARAAGAGSAAREMYVWSDSDQVYKEARIIFTDTEKSNWTWDETAKAYYWHRFFSHQPDLNFDNPVVIEEVLKAMRFWLDMGVDALRMDAIPYLIERDGTSCENLPETHAAIKTIRAAIDEGYANRLVLAEANQWPADVRPYFGDGDECHMAFHFPLMPRIYMALRQEDRLPITDIMAQTPPIPDNCQWGLFLRNHDELTLEMVTDDERDYMYFAYSADPRMRINVGIRRRLAPLVDNNRRRIELLNSLLLSFPGTPIMYYGDELGMGDNIYLGDRNGVRTPMQWNSDRNAGFSKCDPARLYFPVVMDPIYGYQVINVEAQLSDQSSLLHWTRNMIALRKLFQVFGRGTLRFLNPANRKILAYLRDLDRGDGTHETVLCVANLSRFAQPVSLDLADHAGLEPVEMLGYVPFPTITDTPYALTLTPYSFLWLELQPANAKPETAVELLPDALSAMDEGDPVSSLDVSTSGWAGLFSDGQALFDTAMRSWLRKQRWFGAKSRTILSLRVINWVELPVMDVADGSGLAPRERLSEVTAKPALVFIELQYTDESLDTYQLPLAISSGAAADDIGANHSDLIVATLPAGLLLHDATALKYVRSNLLSLIERNTVLPLTTSGASNTAYEAGISTSVTATPAPLDAQPGEAVPKARGGAPVVLSTATMLPRESPIAGGIESASTAQGSGHLAGRPTSAYRDRNMASRLTSRVGSVEQSNTSVLYGEDLILKLFRRVQPGENPDVEIGRFLTEVAHYSHIPPLLGEISITPADGEKTTIVMLQGLVANEGDGWQWFLDQLGEYFSSVAGLATPPEMLAPGFLDERELPREARDLAPAALEAAALLGKRTAEMHLALSTATEDPAFTSEPLSRADLTNDSRRIDAQINSTLEALKVKLSTLKDLTADDAALLLSRRINLFDRAHSITSSSSAGLKIRIHGDYHLGQILRTPALNGEPGDFVLLDFEGEPARPLVERRQKQSPLKDVAGMLRSFSYVSHAGLDQYLTSNDVTQTSEIDSISGWARLWQNSVSAEFLRGYREAIGANPTLLPSPQQSQSLLAAYLLEKALYELLYELNNRPGWLRIPLTGILAL